jgi:hypothetical protein
MKGLNMPNWCSNALTLAHPDPAMIQRVVDAPNGELFSEFFPVPEALKNITADSSTDEGVELSRQNIEAYGDDNAYDWCITNWSTKWDVEAEVLMATDTNVDLAFDSAWGPPVAWYERMMDLGFTVDAYYYESGMGFCGHWSDGEDEYHEVPESSAETKAKIPSDIDDMFSISENQWEWEQENRDDLQAWIEVAVEQKATDDQAD